MRHVLLVAAIAMSALGASGCSGYGSAPSLPDAVPMLAPGTVVVDIVGINGAMSFVPNPAAVPPATPIVWHNRDSTTHHVVFGDGELDTGAIPPGGYSQPTNVVAAGPYHCSIHPEMVGAVKQ